MDKNENISLESFLPLLKKGDKKAFKIIFNAYYKRLYSFSLNYVGEKYAAEEIVENTLLKLWQKRNKVDKIKNLKSYLYAMVRNASIDFNKKEKKFIRLEVDKHDTVSQKNQFIIEEETYAILFQALEDLPEKCRKVFELSCLEGIKYKDIAEDLQISINTVKSQRARAIALLKENLKDRPLFQILLASF
ncbi:RNA polymerase sigma-70 factor [Flavobacteriaceae bacterium GSB9]|nr:RNA polymerase sigma-70 factor [Flavobacteriaceae bacterium GSB9]